MPLTLPSESEILSWLVQWGQARDDIRALILTSTRTNPNVRVDLLSDYDVIVAVRDIQPFLDDPSWLEDYDPVLVLWRDPVRQAYGFDKFARITEYENGIKIDYSIFPVELVQHLAALPELPDWLDVGYRVLLDKDGLTAGLQPPSYRAFIPSPPSAEEYFFQIENFFHEATYAAKNLWRRELLPVKYFLDHDMKQEHLRLMLEWYMEIDHDWSVKLGIFGRGMQKHLPPDLWAELEATYAGAGLQANWQAFFATLALYRKLALKVGLALGFEYPWDLDRKAVAHFRAIQQDDEERNKGMK